MNIVKLWDLYADGDSQWDSLTEGEKLMFTASLEREACAKVCDDLLAPDIYTDTDKSMWDVTCTDCAAAIRARGTT